MTIQQLPSLASQATLFGVLYSRIRKKRRGREVQGVGEWPEESVKDGVPAVRWGEAGEQGQISQAAL